MSITPILKSCLFLGLTVFAGCFQPKTTTDSSGDGGDGSGPGGSGEATTIYDIQMNNISEGTVVSIEGAVVTTQITEGDNPAFFVQSAEGGEYNGIYIFKYDEVEYTPVIGDIINITGEYTEFHGLSQLKVTEPGNIEKTGTGGEVVVTDVSSEPDNWEAYESVMVRFTDIEISDASKLYEWGAVELANGCWMDNDFTDYDAEDGARYSSITGPITYSFEKFAILPRSTEDLVGYTGTPGGGSGSSGDSGGDSSASGGGSSDSGGDSSDGGGGPDSETVCDDGIDNDGNGFTDCDDFDCAEDPACEEDCSDGIDNDEDGTIDCDDLGCAHDEACAEDCSDGIDNDEDGHTDCDDYYCEEDAACTGDGEE